MKLQSWGHFSGACVSVTKLILAVLISVCLVSGGLRGAGGVRERSLMSKVMESVLTVCAVLIVTELLRKFCPESQMVSFVGGLIA